MQNKRQQQEQNTSVYFVHMYDHVCLFEKESL